MKKIIYTKYSNERAKKYAVRTDILQDENRQRYVHKTACYPEGEVHVQNIAKNYYRLEEQFGQTPISMNRCVILEDGVELQYLKGLTMEEQLDAFLYAKEYDKAETLITAYLTEIRKACSQNLFQLTDAFREVFGEVLLPEGLMCADATNIDMVFANVIITGSWDLIDYEWTFDFPIPVHYVIYRILHYYLDVSEMRRRMKDRGLYEKFGIDVNQLKEYEKMERHFQTHIEEGQVPIRDMYPDISPGKLFIGELISNEKIRQRNENLQVFFAGEEEFLEERSEYYPIDQGNADITVTIPAGTQKMRLDPGEKPGLLTVEELRFTSDMETECQYLTNGSVFYDGQILFENADPQIILLEIPEGAGVLHIKFCIDTVSEAAAAVMKQVLEQRDAQAGQVQELTRKLTQREQLIQEMENTKVWKMYQKIKNPDGKGKLNE